VARGLHCHVADAFTSRNTPISQVGNRAVMETSARQYAPRLRILDFKKLFEAAPSPYLALTPNLRIAAVNDEYLRATMSVREAIVGRHLFDVFPDNPADLFSGGVENLAASLSRVLEQHKPDVMPIQKYDIPRPAVLGGGFEERYWSPINTPVLDSGELAFIIHRVEDVTEFVQIRQAQSLQTDAANDLQARNRAMELELYHRAQDLHLANDQLRRSERRLDAIFQQAAAGICQLDLDYRFILVNERFCEIVGRSRRDLLGLSMYDVIHPDDRSRVRSIFENMLHANDSCIMEKRYVRPDGTIVWVDNSASLVRDDQGKPQLIVDVSQDTSARKHAENAQRLLERRVVAAQEEERLRIARELHDQLSQHLAGMLLALESLKGRTTSPESQIEHIQDLVQGMGREVHRVAWELRPTAVDDLGLLESLRQCVEEWSSRSSIPIDFHCDVSDTASYSPEVETICYRVLQESLTNILKHAQATAASVVVKQEGQELRLICEDNGIGFATERLDAIDSRQHLGIRGMRERLSLVGGELHLESSIGGGVSLFFRIPME
jgi:PAS domain S-box-containing protein